MTKLTRRAFNLLIGSAAITQGVVSPPWMFGEAADSDSLAMICLTEASAKIHNRTVTSTQLTQAMLDRISRYNPKVNAYVTVMGQEALKRAAELDAEQKAGRFRGPLHGIPIALKDNIDTAGTRTTAASPMFKDRIPAEDAEIVRRLKAAGAITLGKANLHEFALGCTGDVSNFGPTRNPWALDRVTGGSSAGSAAALSASLCFGALGTDTGGSVRVPASWCGIVGLKPTVGLVSIRGIIPCTASLDHCGPMARTVEDVALMLGQMAGYDALDIFSVPSAPEDYVKSMKQPVSGFRLGMPASFYDHVEPEVLAAVNEAAFVLTRLTAGVVSHAPLLDGPTSAGSLGDSDFYHADLIKQYGLSYMAPTRTRFERMTNPPPGTAVATAADSARAHQRLATIRRTVDAAFKDFDLVVVPTIRNMPPTINASLALETAAAGRSTKVYDWFEGSSACSNTSPFDTYGIPAISIPCGFSSSGLPIGLMIAGPHFAEGKVLALAYAYQQATQWHLKRPPLTAETIVPAIIEGKPPVETK